MLLSALLEDDDVPSPGWDGDRPVEEEASKNARPVEGVMDCVRRDARGPRPMEELETRVTRTVPVSAADTARVFVWDDGEAEWMASPMEGPVDCVKVDKLHRPAVGKVTEMGRLVEGKMVSGIVESETTGPKSLGDSPPPRTT